MLVADNVSMVHHIAQYAAAGDLPDMASSTPFLSSKYGGEASSAEVAEAEEEEEEVVAGDLAIEAAASLIYNIGAPAIAVATAASSPAASKLALPAPGASSSTAASCSLQVPLGSHFSLKNGIFSPYPFPHSDQHHMTSPPPLPQELHTHMSPLRHELNTCNSSSTTLYTTTFNGGSCRAPAPPIRSSLAFSPCCHITSSSVPAELVQPPHYINNSIPTATPTFYNFDPILSLENSFSSLAPNLMSTHSQAHPSTATATACPPANILVPSSFSSSLLVPEMIGAAGHGLAQHEENIHASHRNPLNSTFLQLISTTNTADPCTKRHKTGLPSAAQQYICSIGLTYPTQLHSNNELLVSKELISPPSLQYATPSPITSTRQATGPSKTKETKSTFYGQLNVVAGGCSNIGHHLIANNSSPLFPSLTEADACQQLSLATHSNEQPRFSANSSNLHDQKVGHIAIPFQDPAIRDGTTTYHELAQIPGVVSQAPHEIEHTSSSGSTRFCGSFAGDHQDGMVDSKQYGIMNYASISPNAATSLEFICPISSSNPCNEAENHPGKSCSSLKPDGEKPITKLPRNKVSVHPQGVAARRRRHRISNKFKVLQTLVPGGTKMDTASMLDEAIEYIKYLRHQIWLHQLLEVSQMTNTGEGSEIPNNTQVSFPSNTTTGTSTLDFPGAHQIYSPLNIPPCSNSFFWPTFNT
ncbi:hypothetical protein L7F22_069092 [Adiantum nelumboides]|nr:hypothetical protein [Adiantum nelumboides]